MLLAFGLIGAVATAAGPVPTEFITIDMILALALFPASFGHVGSLIELAVTARALRQPRAPMAVWILLIYWVLLTTWLVWMATTGGLDAAFSTLFPRD